MDRTRSFLFMVSLLQKKNIRNTVGAGSQTIYKIDKQSKKPAPSPPLFTLTIP
ncbi:hypothetical protein [Microcoleus sp. CAWBG58]|uniref:hypothetical protein n=1 Tax=Microcoleus sp. CAWBG58 TaxID=2841651 RepID=UPI0025CC425C|nr:hypothetical protein [Microcoleus sp. CAWBG58]